MIIDCALYRDGRAAASGRHAAAGRRGQPGGRAGSSGRACSNPAWPSWRRSAARSACTSWPSRMPRSSICGPRSRHYEDDVRLVILRTARYDDQREEVDFGEISVFVADGFVITVRQGVASELHGARARLEQRPELLESGQRRGAVGDPGPGHRRLRARGRRARTGHRTGRGDGVLRRGRADRTDLLPAPRGHQLLPRRAPPARRGRRRRARRHREEAAALLPRRARPPQPGQRGGRRPT